MAKKRNGKRKLPKNAKPGSKHTIVTESRNGRREVTFERTRKKGFGKWKAVKNVPA